MLLEEAPVAVDSFNHEAGVTFFCSHAHDDHLKGLSGSWRRGPIYTSHVTARLLRRRWPPLEPFLKPLEIGPVHRILLGSAGGLEIEVCLVDANHVPGSVMFIFSGYFGTLLYTGDFRFHDNHVHLSVLPLLARPNAELSRIFLDNTFCHPQFTHAPRAEVCKAITKRIISKWPCIAFVVIYKLGKESLLAHLAQRLKTVVLLPKDRMLVAKELGLHGSNIREQPCNPQSAPAEELRRRSMQGCIWAVSRRNVRKSLWQATESGAAAHAIDPSGWAELSRNEYVPCYEDSHTVSGQTVPVFVSDDGVSHYPYSDHCSYLELVQFLSCLPSAPVTFIGPLPKPGPFGYDGEVGLNRLLHEAGVPSIKYFQQGGSGKVDRKRPAPDGPDRSNDV
mmetsp:Transcript_41722/g.97429  ORF Transcript_41722/g.97429 Transcript_41722/m.97429 type:complete len:392 (+) Transcript_41722:27-1202(+)